MARIPNWLIFMVGLLGLGLHGHAQFSSRPGFKSHDIGIFLGGTYYIGDLNPSRQFHLSQPGAGIFYRYNPGYRYAYRAGVHFGSILGDDTQSESVDQLERNLNFKSKISEFYGIAEFNFWEYQTGSRFLFAPYLFLGISIYKFEPMANVNDSWISLRDMRTEGQKTTENPNQKPYRLTQLAIPFGIGAKLDLSDYIALSFEWGPRKTFTDFLDDVSGKYVNPAILAAEVGAGSAALADRSNNPKGTLDNVGKMRGNPNNKDWYIFYGFTLNFKLKFKPIDCNSFVD